MKQVTLVENPFEPDTWEVHETEDVCAFLAEKFATFPATAKIYQGEVNVSKDVTPACEAEIDRLQALPGPFFVVVFPEEGAEIPLIIALIVALIAVAVTVSNLPKPTTQANQSTPSPNNDLAARQNSARPFQRIPDIYGTVRSTPDLLMQPYSEYIDNVEYEHAYMCIGRGVFTILDARDDTTPIASIDGASCVVMGPNDSPNIVLPAIIPPRTVFGTGALSPVVNCKRMTSVNGQDLLTDSTTETIGPTGAISLSMPTGQPNGIVEYSGTDDVSDIVAGQVLYLYVKSYKTHHTTHDTFLSGNYVVVSITTTGLPWPLTARIVLANVQSVANDWGWLRDWPSEFFVTDAHMVSQKHLSVGPFLLPQEDQNEVWCNIVALNGLYQLDSSGNATAITADLKATIQPCDTTGNPIGDPYYMYSALVGDSRKVTVAMTWKITLATPGPCLVTLFRTSASPVAQQVSDAIKWRDLYSMTPVTITSGGFGNVTTVYAITKATSGALAVKERKLNLLVQRQLPVRTGPTTFTGLAGSNSIADIFCAAALDQYIGNRDISELDVAGIYATANAIGAYFGTDDAQEFCATFDSNNMSFEDIVNTMAQACFCTPYRQGRFLRLAFEQATEDSKLLFGHRNKIPGSEQRTVAFGPTNDYDAVQLDYTSPVDDSTISLFIPGQGVNMKKVAATGVRNYAQAYFLAWRYWNRLAYQNTSTQFTGLGEGALLLLNDRILVADNTRGGAQDGEVISQNVLELHLSQPVVFETGRSYVILLQGIDGETESIPIHSGSSDYHVVLTAAPTVTLSLDTDASVRALYWIVPDDDARPQAFLVTNREPGDNMSTHKITAINYDARYYSKDGDVLNGTIPHDTNDGHATIIPVRGGGVITM